MMATPRTTCGQNISRNRSRGSRRRSAPDRSPNSDETDRRQQPARRSRAPARTASGAVDELRDAGHQHDLADARGRRGRARRRGTPASGRPSRTARCRARKLSRQPMAKLRSRRCARSTIGLARASVRRTKPHGRNADSASRPSDQRRGPAALRRLLEADLQRGQRAAPAAPRRRRSSDAEPGRVGRSPRAGKPQPAMAAMMPGHDVDQKQPVPGVGLGDPAADDRPERRREHRQHPGDRRRDRLERGREQQEHRGEHRRDQRAAGKSLHDAPCDQRRRSCALAAQPIEARVKSGDGGDEQPAHASAMRVSKPVSGIAMTSAIR